MSTTIRNLMSFAGALACVFSAGVLAVVPISGVESSPVSDGGITPYIIDGENLGGNRTCEEVGLAFFGDAEYYEFSSARVNFNEGAFDQPFPAGLTVSTDGTYISFSSTFHIGAVIVKGSNEANVYVYEPQALSDSGLAAPPNESGGPAGLSNITFCWNPQDPDEQSEWCSPGFWRQSHHLWAWDATGFDPDDKYNTTAALFCDLPALEGDPTLWEVLQSPQIYKGAAFNCVGDMLSDAHPDVNYEGERVEDSCPL